MIKCETEILGERAHLHQRKITGGTYESCDEPHRLDRASRRKNGQELFEPETFTTEELGDPTASLEAIATSVIEVMAGVRQVDLLARYLTDEVFVRLRSRAARAAAKRASSGAKVLIPSISISNVLIESPTQGVIESVVLVRFPQRTRAVAIRLEGINRCWRATAISVI